MKKVLIATGIAALAFASIAGAQGYTFNTNLTVGSTGPDVVALQTWLIANGYSIPSISSGAAAKGYFGSQTKAAVATYQKAVGLPNTGFFGPLTQAKLNSGATMTVGGSTSITCPAGYVCTAVGNTGTGTTGTVSGPTGITTPGVPGIMTVTAGPISSSVLNVGQQNVPVLTIRVQAQYSDLDVQSLTLDLGPNTAIYNKVFNSISVTDGTNVLATQSLSPSTVVQSGSDYVVGIAGFHFIVPKGTYKDLIIKANLNPSIDSSYVAGGSNVPGSQTVAGVSVTGWALGLPANALRGVDGAGLNLYGPTTGIAQALTINKSLVDNAQANISLDPSSPLVASVPVTDTTNGQYLGLPILNFAVNAQNDTLHLHEVKVRIYTSGTGSVGAAYLYNGSTQITSASVSNGIADFTNITDGTNGATIPVNTTGVFSVKVDATGVTNASNPLVIMSGVATSTGSDLVVYNSIDGNVTVSGSATGNTQTVNSVGPLFTLSGTPTITKQVSNTDQNGNATTTYTATFNVNVQAVGASVNLGLPASTTAAFGTSSTSINLAQVYQNGAPTTGFTVIGSYSQPTNTVLSNDGSYFTVAQNQTVTIPVTYSFSVKNPGANVYGVQLQGVNWFTPNAAGPTTFMRNQPSWRTSSI